MPTLPASRYSLVFQVLFFVGLGCIGWLTADWRQDSVDAEMRGRILRTVEDLATAIPPQSALALTFTADDKFRPQFDQIAVLMQDYSKSIPNSGIYSMAMRDGRIVFGPETYPENSPMASPPGSLYLEPTATTLQIFQNKKACVQGPYKDEFGSFISGMAPVLHPETGEVICVVGLDVEACYYLARLERIRQGVLGAFAAFVAIVALARATLTWLSKTTAGQEPKKVLILTALPPIVAGTTILWLTLQFWDLQKHTQQEQRTSTRLLELNGRILYYDEVTAFSSKWSILTGKEGQGGNLPLEDRYRRHRILLLDALIQLKKLLPKSSRMQNASLKDTYDRLDELRQEAFDLLKSGDKQAALRLITGCEYRRHSEAVASLLRQLAIEIETNRHQVLDELSNNLHQVFAALLGVLLSLSMFWRRWLEAEKTARESTQKAQLELKQKIEEATAALQLTNRDLAERDERLTLTLDSINEAFITSNEQGLIIAWNKAAEQIFGWSAAEAIGQPLSIIIPSRYRARHEEGMSRYRNMRTTKVAGQLLEVEGTRKDGSEFSMELTVSPWERYGSLFFTSVAKDVSERNKTKNELRKLSRVVEQAPVPIVITDCQGIIEYANPATAQTTGYSLEEILGGTPRIFKSGISPDSVYKEMWETLMSEREWRGEMANRRKNGEFYWEIVTISPIKNDAGETTHFASVKQDITERKLAEEHLLQAKTESDAANLAKTQFLATMSHELRTPLNAVLGYAQILLREHQSDAKTSRALTTILRSGEHLLSLINDVLDISKVEAGRVELFPKNIHLHDFLDNIWALIKPRFSEKKLVGRIVRDETLPEGIQVDEQKLRQVLLNLLGNAVKFTDKGSIELRALCQGGRLIFEIQDTGPGIAPQDLSTIFEPFQQVGSIERRAEGSGLGLAIVKRILSLMSGSVQASSILGQGSLFTVDIPLVPVTLDPSAMSSPVTHCHPQGYEGPRKKILVVDDKTENRSLLMDLLQPLGFEIRLCDSGNRAIETASIWQPHLIFMDLRMPSIDGLETTRLLRSSILGPGVKIIAISASAFDLDQADCLQAGCNDFLPKPFKEQALFDMISRHLGITWNTAPQTQQLDRPIPDLEWDPGHALPSKDQLSHLLDLAKRGNLKQVGEQAASLALENHKLQPFSDRVANLVSSYKIKLLKEWIELLIKTNKNNPL